MQSNIHYIRCTGSRWWYFYREASKYSAEV